MKINNSSALQNKDLGYFEAQQEYYGNLEFFIQEKERTKTEDKPAVSEFIKIYKELKESEISKTPRILLGIYKKNEKEVFENAKVEPNKDLLSLVAHPEMLMRSYHKLKKNKGAMTRAFTLSRFTFKSLSIKQKRLYNKICSLPDEMKFSTILEISDSIKKGKYVWGASRRKNVPKPNKPGSSRPITITPFSDKMVQLAIAEVLQAIFEPKFEFNNNSFAFRPNKSVHDAIYVLKNHTDGMKIALEGDIKGAYDNVSRKKMIEILREYIKDEKFIKFIEKRLDYEYFDTDKKVHMRDKDGLPQGGSDCPYLWNIYMLKFDEFVNDTLNKLADKLNKKLTTKKNSDVSKVKNKKNPEKNKLSEKINTIKRLIKWINLNKKHQTIEQIVERLEDFKLDIKGITDPILKKRNYLSPTIDIALKFSRSFGFMKLALIKTLKAYKIRFRKIPFIYQNQKKIRFKYSRFADDFLILSNGNMEIMKKLKESLSIFLESRLSAILEDKKTLITKIDKKPAKFLGFEIKTYSNRRIVTYKRNKEDKEKNNVITSETGNKIILGVDKEKIKKRLIQKGYCDDKLFPRENKTLTYLETFTIIDRYNSVLRGFSNYYAEFVNNAYTDLNRWIYIIRYSCIKTIAMKLKISVREVFKRFHINKSKSKNKIYGKENTIQIIVYNTIAGKKFEKTWVLETKQSLINKAFRMNNLKKTGDIFRLLEKKIPIKYEGDQKRAITNTDYLEKLIWVNKRSRASLDSPCCMCGSPFEVEMHHIKHVRKNKYSLIDKSKTWEQSMWLRSRNQIPLCRYHHMNVVHKGKYGGTAINSLVPKILWDNRILTIESYIKANPDKNLIEKTMLDKGWKTAE